MRFSGLSNPKVLHSMTFQELSQCHPIHKQLPEAMCKFPTEKQSGLRREQKTAGPVTASCPSATNACDSAGECQKDNLHPSSSAV